MGCCHVDVLSSVNDYEFESGSGIGVVARFMSSSLISFGCF